MWINLMEVYMNYIEKRRLIEYWSSLQEKKKSLERQSKNLEILGRLVGSNMIGLQVGTIELIISELEETFPGLKTEEDRRALLEMSE